MRIAVLHHSLNLVGGAERLCLSAMEALKARGHRISLVTVERTDWSDLQDKFGSLVRPDEEIYVTTQHPSQRLKKIPVASGYFLFFAMQLASTRLGRKYDLTLNTFGDAINSFADVSYIHFPLKAALEFSQVPSFTHTSLWKSLSPLYNIVMSTCEEMSPSRLLLTNSVFMKNVIRASLHRVPAVVYPPVDVESFSSGKGANRYDGLVVVVASYAPKRHLEQIPLIAKQAEDARFVVIGKTNEYSESTLRRLEYWITKLGVGERVTLLKNLPFRELLEILSRAKVYLHTMPFDHFGISVVEAMASGCVPVVPRSGGPWMDILGGEQGVFGFSYESVVEAGDQIERLINDETLRRRIVEKTFLRAKEFDKSVFMRRLVEEVEKALP
ncbi:MAG: hypothetical protein QG670_1323 [Thermoproteota archaeon]|nr:hypothetical protein [Thermoproteota archaeon]